MERRQEDDRCLAKTDLSSLTPQELERENDRRRMRWYGPPEVLRKQLEDWLSLSLDADIPQHVLLFLQPCGTKADAMLQYLTQQERDHILGLDKYVDTRTYRQLRTVTETAMRDEVKAKAAKAESKG